MTLIKSSYYQVRVLFSTIFGTTGALYKSGLGSLIPLFWGLLFVAVLLVLINSVSPLAPFVYSLF